MGPVVIPLITMKRTDGNWTATYRKVLSTYIPDTSRTAIPDDLVMVPFQIKTKSLSPKSSWRHIQTRMEELELFILPDMNDIPNLNDGYVDGDSFIVEIATVDSYRAFSYHVPQKFAANHWQVQNMVNFLDLIDSEFGIAWNWERDHWRIMRMNEEFNHTSDSVILRERSFR
jgi:hypothetical protein